MGCGGNSAPSTRPLSTQDSIRQVLTETISGVKNSPKSETAANSLSRNLPTKKLNVNVGDIVDLGEGYVGRVSKADMADENGFAFLTD